MPEVSQRSVLITGAARRIGRRLAIDLAQEGWAVAIHCNESIEDAETLAKGIEVNGGRAVIVRGDLSQHEAPQRLIDEASHALGGLSCLINNASRFEPDEAGSVTLQSWTAHLDTNLRAPVFLSQGFAAQLPEGAEGNIINIIDQRVWRLTPKFFSYTASKSALWTVTRTLAWPSCTSGVSRRSPPIRRSSSRAARLPAPSSRWPSSARPGGSCAPPSSRR